MNNQKIIKNKIILKDIKYWRWLGFILAVVGAYILGNLMFYLWLGWTICWYPAVGLSWELRQVTSFNGGYVLYYWN